MRYKELLIVLLIGVIVFLLFQKRPMYVANRLQTIEHVIQGKDSIVTIWKTKIIQDKGRIKGLYFAFRTLNCRRCRLKVLHSSKPNLTRKWRRFQSAKTCSNRFAAGLRYQICS